MKIRHVCTFQRGKSWCSYPSIFKKTIIKETIQLNRYVGNQVPNVFLEVLTVDRTYLAKVIMKNLAILEV